MLKRLCLALFFATAPLHADQTPAAPAQPTAPAAAPVKNDYADAKNWLCKPGRQDACAVDLRTTVVKADGSLTREEWKGDPNAPIDCFYVYPTVSRDPTDN